MLLENALYAREREYRAAIDRLRELATDATESEVDTLPATLREAVELVGCLRRMTVGRSAKDVHAAFGAPGDFGYGTPIGDALAKLYRGGAS